MTVLGADYASMPPLFHLDDYDRCMSNKQSSLYCSFVYQLEPENRKNVSDVWNVVEVRTSLNYVPRIDYFVNSDVCLESEL